jgi:hypothetical protein
MKCLHKFEVFKINYVYFDYIVDIQGKNGIYSHTDNRINNWDHCLSYYEKHHNSMD